MRELIIHLTGDKIATLKYPHELSVEDITIIKEAIDKIDFSEYRTHFLTLQRGEKTVTISGRSAYECTAKWDKLYPNWECIRRL